MEKEIKDLLVTIGLTEGEAKSYLALSSIGSSTVGNIIKESEVSASKVYQILDRLMEKGLVSVMVDQGRKVFTARPPDSLLEYLDRETQQIEQNKNKISEIIPILKAKQDSIENLPLTEFVKGKKGFESFSKQMVDEAKEGDTYNVIVSQRGSFKLQTHWYPLSVKLAEKKIPQKIVYEYVTWFKKDPNVHRRKERKLYYPKLLGKEYSDLPEISTLGRMVLIKDLDEKGEIFTLVIRNKNVARSFTKIIDAVRSLGEVPEGFQRAPDE